MEMLENELYLMDVARLPGAEVFMYIPSIVLLIEMPENELLLKFEQSWAATLNPLETPEMDMFEKLLELTSTQSWVRKLNPVGEFTMEMFENEQEPMKMLLGNVLCE